MIAMTAQQQFQSTLLMRGATQDLCGYHAGGYFNPRSSCEERPGARRMRAAASHDFNPRSSCEERPARRGRGSIE